MIKHSLVSAQKDIYLKPWEVHVSDNGLDEAAQKKQLLTGMFNRSAPTYDHVGPSFFAHYGQKLVDFAKINTGDGVLDIATGRGAVLFPAAGAVGAGGHVVGIDLSETMISQARLEIELRKLENAHVEQMDAESLRFPDESFDGVLCGFALFFFPRLEVALSEMMRVLRPGGWLAVSTWEKYEDKRWSWFDELVDQFLPPEGDKVPAKSPKISPVRLDTAESMQAVMRAAGFTSVECRSEQLDVVYQSDEEWWAAQWSHGGRLLLEKIEAKLGAEGLERFRKAALVGLNRIQQDDGIHTCWPALFTKALKPGK